jgi:hypothetical protein
MPDVAGGWLCSLLGTLGRILGGKLYILGVAGYDTPIWDVLALQEEQEEAGERLYGAKLINFSQLGKRCQMGLLGLGFAPGLAGLGFS